MSSKGRLLKRLKVWRLVRCTLFDLILPLHPTPTAGFWTNHTTASDPSREAGPPYTPHPHPPWLHQYWYRQLVSYEDQQRFSWHSLPNMKNKCNNDLTYKWIFDSNWLSTVSKYVSQWQSRAGLLYSRVHQKWCNLPVVAAQKNQTDKRMCCSGTYLRKYTIGNPKGLQCRTSSYRQKQRRTIVQPYAR